MALQKKIKLIHDAISTCDYRSALKLCNRRDLTHIPVVKVCMYVGDYMNEYFADRNSHPPPHDHTHYKPFMSYNTDSKYRSPDNAH